MTRPHNATDWRLRPRDGKPRSIVELVAQFIWTWRIELSLFYIVGMITWTVLVAKGVL